MRLKEPLRCKLRHRIIDDGLRGLVVVLAVVTIISAMSNANLTDDDSESCSGTVAVSIVAAAAEHDESSAEDQLLFLKVRRDAAAGVDFSKPSRVFAVSSPAAHLHSFTNTHRCCYYTGIENQLQRV